MSATPTNATTSTPASAQQHTATNGGSIASCNGRNHAHRATSPHQLKALLFDIDGTLCDTDHLHIQQWADLLRPLGINVDKVYYNAYISGAANVTLSERYWPELTAEQRAAIMSEKERKFREVAADTLTPLPGLIDLMDFALNNDIRIACVTNAPRENADFILSKLNIVDKFHILVIGGELPHSKPHPLPYLDAMRQFDVTPDQCIVFEDSVNGVRAGHASGACTVGVLTSHVEQTLIDAGAQYTIEDYRQVRLDQTLLDLKDFVKPRDRLQN